MPRFRNEYTGIHCTIELDYLPSGRNIHTYISIVSNASLVAELDLVPLTVTLIFCIFLSLEYGMIIGILVNLVLLLYFTARPGVLVEEEVVQGNRILLITPRQSLSFPAAEYLRQEVIVR